MNCAEVRFLITMHREGERTTGQEVFLSKHLESCSACASLSKEYEEALAQMPTQPGDEVVLAAPQAFTNAILDQTIRSHRPRSFQTLVDSILEPGSRPPVRRVLFGSVGLVIVFFVLQAASLLTDIHAMETTLAYRQGKSSSPMLRIDRSVDLLLSAETKRLISNSLGIDRFEKSLSALSSGERTQALEFAKRLRDNPLQSISRQQWKMYLESATKHGPS